jgi:hypothetical protein
MAKNIPTIAELQKTIELYNEAHKLDLDEVAAFGVQTLAGTDKSMPNQFLEDLFLAAQDAAAALKPLMKVQLKAVAKK